jgi:hypothetical protein
MSRGATSCRAACVVRCLRPFVNIPALQRTLSHELPANSPRPQRFCERSSRRFASALAIAAVRSRQGRYVV